MAQPADTVPPLLVEAMRVNEPSGERDNKVEVEGSKEEGEELLKRSRPAKAPARPTVPMRSKSIRGISVAETTTSRRMRARKGMRDQGGRRRVVLIVVEVEGLTYEKERVGASGRIRDDC